MGYSYDPNLDKDDDEQPVIKASGASSTADPAGGVSSKDSGKKLETGSGFQNLDAYLNTNDAKSFGQQVTGKVADDISSAKSNQSQAAEGFSNVVNTTNILPTEEQVQSAISNPIEADKDVFQSWMSQNYDGPKSLAETNNLYNQFWSGTQKANTTSKLLGSEAGRFTLLDTYFGNPKYSFGEKTLDNILVQNAGIGKDTRKLQNEAATLKGQGDIIQSDLSSLAAQRAGVVDESRNLTNSLYDAGVAETEKSIKDRLSSEASVRSKKQEEVQKALKELSLDDKLLNELGLTRGTNLYNINSLDNYLNVNSVPLTISQVATPEQRARINALAELAGNQQTFLGNEQEIADPYTFNAGRLQSDLAEQKALYENNLRDARRSLATDQLINKNKVKATDSQKEDIANYIDYIDKNPHVLDGLGSMWKDLYSQYQTIKNNLSSGFKRI